MSVTITAISSVLPSPISTLLSTVDELLDSEELELVSTEAVLDSTELLLISLTVFSPQPTSKTAAQNAKAPIIFLLCFIEFPPCNFS